MILECRDICYQYPNAEAPVFDRLSFRIEAPGFHALFGSSGVGKTSLAKIITQRISGFSGEVTTPIENGLLYTYNLERLPDWSQVGKHLEKITPPHEKSRLEALVALFGLQGHLTSRFSRLSLGQQNRVNLIRYLLQDFELMILDESLANVDEKTRERIIFTIKAQFPNKCFLYISHNLAEIAEFCDHIFVLRSREKSPQMLLINGQNRIANSPPNHKKLSGTMLEIMNAV
ncbi:MAG: ATP-binding cassette domain-containing protein [Desulfobacterales bacterium]|jgi:ABC-type multidrug transport system ATPase subunit|nr:ATP-binding cassette domain-containing protein [Desulfobacterales bacterium]